MDNPHLKIPWTQILIICSLLLLLFLLPPFLQNSIILGHDTFLHLAYIHAFDTSFFQGQFPVRVIDWFFPGYTNPLFNFYQPGFFYTMALLKLVGFSYSTALNFGLFFLWIASGAGMFLFVKERFSNTLAGLMSGLLYIFAPYHIVDIFVRAAFPEFMALTVVPIWFWTTTMFAKTKRNRWIVLAAFSFALLLLAHPPTTLMFIPLMIGYVCLLSWEQKSFRLVWNMSASVCIGFLLVAFFFIPALVEQQFIHLEMATTNTLYDFHNHFVCINQFFTPSWGYGLSVRGCNDTMTFQLGLVHWISIALAILLVVYLRFFKKSKQKITSFITGIIFFLCFVGSLFMATTASLPLWEHAPFVHFILYPWRFLAVSIFTSSFLAGYALSLVKKPYNLIVYALCIYGIFYWNIPYIHANSADSNAVGFNEQNYLVGDPMFQNITYSPDKMFFPKEATMFGNPRIIPQSEATVLRGTATLKQLTHTATEKSYRVSAYTPATIRLFVAYFPGWSVSVDNKQTTIDYRNPYGYMDVSVPEGQHTMAVQFSNTLIRTLSNWISLVTLGGIVLYVWRVKKSER